MTTTRTVIEKADVDDGILETAYDIVEGWYMEAPIDRADFIDQLEKWTGFDFGDQINSPAIEYIIRKARAYRREA